MPRWGEGAGAKRARNGGAAYPALVEAAQLGTVALWAATVAAGVSVFYRPKVFLRTAVALAALTTVVLAIALVRHDFSLAYVARTTSLATPWPYRLSALWGGMEGSMLFYTAMLLGVGARGVRGRGDLEHRVVAGVGLAALTLTAVATSPFERLPIPAVDGQGLLAILQHPAMIYHPPILYLGLTALVVPFALTVGSLARKEETGEWIPTVRRAALVPWTLLTLGMVAGANWAYVELGWGGFWAWDPVENTALMPWLGLTVFLHTSRVTRRDRRLHRWTVFFALFPFALSVLGVYLTRSGVTGSIHSFAEDPVVGRALLVAAAVSAVVVSWMALRSRRGEPWPASGLARPAWLAASGILVGLVLAFVLVGSAYPAYVSVFGDDTLVLDTTYFVTMVLAPAVVVAVLIGFALQTTWVSHGVELTDLVVFAAGAAVAVGGLSWVAEAPAWPGLVLGAAAGGSLAVILRHIRGRLLDPAVLAHAGLVMVLVGAAGSSLGTDTAARMREGDTIRVGSHTLQLLEVTTGERANFVFAEGRFLVDDRVELRPQIRGYEAQRLPVAEPALWSTPVADVIVAVSLMTVEADGFDVAVFVRPLVWWVWAGAVVLTLAGIAALSGRSGASAGRRRVATEEPRPAGTTSGTTSG